jgi:hypothetical protein
MYAASIRQGFIGEIILFKVTNLDVPVHIRRAESDDNERDVGFGKYD